MKTILSLFAVAALGAAFFLVTPSTAVADPPPRPGITVCVLALCPNSDIAVGVCATGPSAGAARGQAISRIYRTCAELGKADGDLTILE